LEKGNKMQIHDFLLLAYKAFDGKMSGKTKLQERLYFLGLVLNKKKLGFNPHYYGPYSSCITCANDRLLSLGFINEKVQYTREIRGDRGFKVVHHNFELSKSGNEVANVKSNTLLSDWEKIQDAVAKIRPIDNLSYIELSIAAKAHYILTKEGDKFTPEEIKKLVSKFQWQITSEELANTTDFLMYMQTVKG